MVFDFHGRVVVASLGGWENLSALLMSHIHKVLLLFRILSDKGVWCWKTIKVQIDAQKMGKVTFTRPAAQNGVFKCWSKDAGAHFGKVPSQWSVKVGATFNKWKFYFICTATSSPATTSDAFQENSKSTTFWKVPPHRKLSCIIVNQIFPSSWWQVSLLNGRTAASSFWKIGVDLSNGFSPTTTSLFTHTHAHTLHVFGKFRKVYFLRIYWHMFMIFTKVTQCKHVFFFLQFSQQNYFFSGFCMMQIYRPLWSSLEGTSEFLLASTIYFSKMTFSFRGKSLNAKIHVWYSWIKK